MHQLLTILAAAAGVHLIAAQSNTSCIGGEGAGPVDWFVIFKDPASLTLHQIVAAASPAWQVVSVPITNTTGNPIYDTVAAFVEPSAASANASSPVLIAYNDQPPGVVGVSSMSNSKGLVIADPVMENGTTVYWLMHTVPKFLAHAGGYLWPTSQSAKGHMFMCLTFDEAAIGTIGQQLRYQQALIYYFNIPSAILDTSTELGYLVNDVAVMTPPFSLGRTIKTTSKTAQIEVKAYSKTVKSMLDSYKKYMRGALQGNMKIWTKSKSDYPNYCHTFSVRKIISPITINGLSVTREDDSSKWFLSEGTTKYWCFTSSEYSANEKHSPGTVMCVSNPGVFALFSTIAVNVEECEGGTNGACGSCPAG